MKLKEVISLCLILAAMLVSSNAMGQYSFSRKPSIEKFFHVGGAYFFGDLGGRNRNSVLIMGYEEIDIVKTKPNLGFGLRRNFNKYISIRGNFNYAQLQENDALSVSKGRRNRNLEFRTNIYELTITPEIRVARFDIDTKRRRSTWEYYVFGGVGAFYHNPKTHYKGQYVALRPLGTEGQGIKENTKLYSPVAICLPVGGGLRLGINYTKSIFCEISYRITSTDYIDDVSTQYYSRESLANERGQAAADLSYRGPKERYKNGADRGNKFNNDSYLFFAVGFATSLKSIKPRRYNGQ